MSRDVVARTLEPPGRPPVDAPRAWASRTMLLLPTQVSAGSRESTPERRLLVAVLEDALASLALGRVEAVAYIRSDARYLFSFVVACEALGIDVDAVRGRVLG